MALDAAVNRYAAVAAPATLAAQDAAAERQDAAARSDGDRGRTIEAARAQAQEGGR